MNRLMKKPVFLSLALVFAIGCSTDTSNLNTNAKLSISSRPVDPYELTSALKELQKKGKPDNKLGFKIKSAGSNIFVNGNYLPSWWVTGGGVDTFTDFVKSDPYGGSGKSAYPNYGNLNRSSDILYSRRYACYNINSTTSGVPGTLKITAAMHELAGNVNAQGNIAVVVNGVPLYNIDALLTEPSIKPGLPKNFIGQNFTQFGNFGTLSVPINNIQPSNEVCIANNSLNGDEFLDIQVVDLVPVTVAPDDFSKYYIEGTYKSTSDSFQETIKSNKATLFLEANAFHLYGTTDIASDIAFIGQKLSYVPVFSAPTKVQSCTLKIKAALDDTLATTVPNVSSLTGARKIDVLLNGLNVYSGEPFPVGIPDAQFRYTNNVTLSITISNIKQVNDLKIVNSSLGFLAIDSISFKNVALQ